MFENNKIIVWDGMMQIIIIIDSNSSQSDVLFI